MMAGELSADHDSETADCDFAVVKNIFDYRLIDGTKQGDHH